MAFSLPSFKTKIPTLPRSVSIPRAMLSINQALPTGGGGNAVSYSPVLSPVTTYSSQPAASVLNSQTGYPALKPNFGFTDLAEYEESRRKELGGKIQGQIGQLRTGIQSQYDKALTDYKNQANRRRAELAGSLSETAQKNFQMQMPGILEDLNSRGVFSSPTAVAHAQAQALKELELANQEKLLAFDTSTQSFEDTLARQRLQELNQLESSGTMAGIQSEQDALDAALDLRRGELERQILESNATREENLARDLASKQSRTGLSNALIGAGGNIAGGLLPSLLSGSAAGGAGAAGAGGIGGLGIIGAGAGASLGSMIASRAAEKEFGPLGGHIANPGGYTLNRIQDNLSTPQNIPREIPLVKGASSVSKSIKKAFCFDAQTPITMEDGSTMSVCHLYLGAETKGGIVVSLRTARTDDGTRYVYKGVRVTGTHAVKEDGHWLRVKDSNHATPLKGGGVVWSIVTDKHRVYVNGMEFADEYESDNYEYLTMAQSLKELNNQEMSEVA